ncbi:regulator of G-protein signaling 9-binding protein-like [Ptychodera flava]|uniref:regulator of G-protein signaling 9-binding protein-like n=1 Tax=Ptychodera flava TaxID=63121 RepID=UPI00396A085E
MNSRNGSESTLNSRCHGDQDGKLQIQSVNPSEDETEEIELTGKSECARLVSEFNCATAYYRNLVIALGGSNDSECLRDEIKKVRRKAHDLAKHNKYKLMPHLRNNFAMKADRTEYERLWNAFTACFEVFENQMRKSLELERTFPIHAGPHVFINTGIVEPLPNENSPVSLEHLDVPSIDKRVLEREELKLLERDIVELREMATEMHRSIDVKPWTVEAVTDTKLEIDKSQSSLSGIESSADVSLNSFDRRRQRKCVCLVTVTLSSLIIFAIVLAVCLTTLSP